MIDAVILWILDRLQPTNIGRKQAAGWRGGEPTALLASTRLSWKGMTSSTRANSMMPKGSTLQKGREGKGRGQLQPSDRVHHEDKTQPLSPSNRHARHARQQIKGLTKTHLTKHMGTLDKHRPSPSKALSVRLTYGAPLPPLHTNQQKQQHQCLCSAE
jgi:hypothetical protein